MTAPETLALIEETRRLIGRDNPEVDPCEIWALLPKLADALEAAEAARLVNGHDVTWWKAAWDKATDGRLEGYNRLGSKVATALDERDAAMAALREERQNAAREREEWQDASGLCVPAEEAGGDPGGVTPRHLAEYVHGLVKEAEGLRERLAEAEANHEGALKAAAYWKDRHGDAESRAKAAEELAAVRNIALGKLREMADECEAALVPPGGQQVRPRRMTVPPSIIKELRQIADEGRAEWTYDEVRKVEARAVAAEERARVLEAGIREEIDYASGWTDLAADDLVERLRALLEPKP